MALLVQCVAGASPGALSTISLSWHVKAWNHVPGAVPQLSEHQTRAGGSKVQSQEAMKPCPRADCSNSQLNRCFSLQLCFLRGGYLQTLAASLGALFLQLLAYTSSKILPESGLDDSYFMGSHMIPLKSSTVYVMTISKQ